jgi:hypothetical protein
MKALLAILFFIIPILVFGQDTTHATYKIKKESGCQVKIAGRVIHSGDTMSKDIFLNAAKIELSGCGDFQHVLSYYWFCYTDGKQEEVAIETDKIIPRIKNWVTQKTDTVDFVIHNIVCFSTEGDRIINNPVILKLIKPISKQ